MSVNIKMCDDCEFYARSDRKSIAVWNGVEYRLLRKCTSPILNGRDEPQTYIHWSTTACESFEQWTEPSKKCETCGQEVKAAK